MHQDDQESRVEQQAKLDALREEHRALDVQIADLTARPYISPEDQVEINRLKKLKLRKKDEIFLVATQIGADI